MSTNKFGWLVYDRNRHFNWEMESVLGMDSSHKDGNHNIVIYLFIERGRIEANIEELDFVDGKERVISR